MSKKTNSPRDQDPERPKGPTDAMQQDAQQDEVPAARQERRSRHRVTDDQKSGQGSLSALSKMQMLERRRAILNPRRRDPSDY